MIASDVSIIELRSIAMESKTGKATKRPNQALQTTPMTRSVYEKTIEFVDPKRGV